MTSTVVNPITYRPLRREEAPLLATIDRAEEIDGVYALSAAGTLVLHARHERVAGWDPGAIQDLVPRTRAVVDAGGTIHGAWSGAALVGFSSLDVRPVGGDAAVMKLDLLYVSSGFRDQGIGKRLFALAEARARAGGAQALYISATPSRNTVDRYLRMGATLLGSPDPVLLAAEPEDIHLLFALDRRWPDK